MSQKILITLATGKTGYETTVQLLRAGQSVRIFVRSRNARALALEKLGAEIALGEFDDYAALRQALTGVGSVYYCYPIRRGMRESVRLFIRAAREAGTGAVVFMGQWLAEFDQQESLLTNDIKASYQLLEASGLNVVYFIPGYFAENTIGVVLEFAVQLGLLVSPFGAGRNPVPSNEDLAACLAALLQNPVPYFGQRLRPTGPKSLSAPEMADVVARVTGRKVRVVAAPEWLFVKAAFFVSKAYGFDAFAISQARLYNRQYQQNKFDVGGPTDVVKRLTGREPDDFETIVRRYIAASSYGMPSLSGWISAFGKFMAVPIQPVPSSKEMKMLNR